MRSLAALLFLLAACGAPMQTLDSPCNNRQSFAFDAQCTRCDTDADCFIIGNPCNASAICVPAGGWAITAQACSSPYQVPPASSCGCSAGACQAR